MMNEDRAFADLLNHYLRNDKRSARWLASEIGVHPSTVSRWTNGETLPEDPGIVRRIANAFKLSDPAEIEALVLSAGYSFTIQEREVQPDTAAEGIDLSTAHEEHLFEAFSTTLLRLANAVPPPLAALLFEQFHLYNLRVSIPSLEAHSPSLDDMSIDLAHRRLAMSNAFGSYFTGLLERDNIYVEIPRQVDCPVMFGRPELTPLSRIMLALHHSQGPHMVVIAAEGGMGKSTLAAKIVRSLVEEQIVDRILGDSAKVERVDAVTGEIVRLEPGYYDWQSCCAKLLSQLGVPAEGKPFSKQHAIHILRNRLVSNKAVIVIDNLESISKRSQLLDFLRPLASENVRIVVTTRTVQDIYSFAYRTIVVNLKPITKIKECRTFLLWHIEHFQKEYAELRKLDIEGVGEERIQDLISRTGGIPLLLQLVISTVARISWAYLDELPSLFGRDLLNFLYWERWQELDQAGHIGLFAQKLLKFTSHGQYQGKIVTLQMLSSWSAEEKGADTLQSAILLLHERFLIVNHDQEVGNFTVFPSLASFLDGLESAQT